MYEMRLDELGRRYYWNQQDGSSSWMPPPPTIGFWQRLHDPRTFGLRCLA